DLGLRLVHLLLEGGDPRGRLLLLALGLLALVVGPEAEQSDGQHKHAGDRDERGRALLLRLHRADLHLLREALLLERRLCLDSRAPLRLLDPKPLLALTTLRLLARLPLRFLDGAAASFLLLASTALRLLLGADTLFLGAALRLHLLVDPLLLNLAQLAEREENRAFFPLSHVSEPRRDRGCRCAARAATATQTPRNQIFITIAVGWQRPHWDTRGPPAVCPDERGGGKSWYERSARWAWSISTVTSCPVSTTARRIRRPASSSCAA